MKILYITGGDYAALTVEEEIGIKLATKMTEEAGGKLVLDGDFYAELEIKEFGQVDEKFIRFINSEIVDYDQSKDTNFFVIEEEE